MNHSENKNAVIAKVVNIYWERVNLYIDVKTEFADEVIDNLDFYAVNRNYEPKAKFTVINKEDNIYRLYLNITNPGYNLCMQRGAYNIYVCSGDDILAVCMTDESIVEKMSDYSKSFLFKNRSRVYNVVFSVDDNSDEDLPFLMYTMASTAVGIGPVPDYLINNNHGYVAPLQNLNNSKFAKFKKKNTPKFLKAVYDFYCSLYKSKRNSTILFMSEQNDKIGTNEEAVYNKMLERHLDEKFTIEQSFRNAVAGHNSVMSWLGLVKKLAKSSTVILDDHAPILDWLILNDTKVIQLWHAGAGFKSSGYSRWGNTGCPAPFSCHRQYTYGIAGSKQIAHFFSEVWGINTEQVLPTGMPRMDEYLDENYKAETVKKIYEEYPICKGKKVILFAPTYRGKNKALAYYPYNLIDFQKLYDTCGDEYVVLFKMHPWVAEPVPIDSKYSDKFIDVGKYPNINDLFYITDLLITDYSSNIFEYSLNKKPMLFFAFDEIQYSFSRGFHRNYAESAPGKIVHDFDALIEAIKNKDFETEKVYKYVEEHFDYIDSGASDRVIDWLILDNMPEEFRNAIDRKNEDVMKTLSLDFRPDEFKEG